MACFETDPAVEPLRRANPNRYKEVKAGHLAVVAVVAVVAGVGRPWFIGRVGEVIPLPNRRTPAFVHLINVDSGDVERVPARWIVELMACKA